MNGFKIQNLGYLILEYPHQNVMYRMAYLINIFILNIKRDFIMLWLFKQ